MTRARGRPRKRVRNISGLRNQGPKLAPSPSPSFTSTSPPTSSPTSPPPPPLPALAPISDVTVYTSRGEGGLVDVDVDLGDGGMRGAELASELDPDLEIVGMNKPHKSFRSKPVMVHSTTTTTTKQQKRNQKQHDEDAWNPTSSRKKKPTIGRPKTYIKGPDVMSKSVRTRFRYRKAMRGQTSLDAFVSMAGSGSVRGEVGGGGEMSEAAVLE